MSQESGQCGQASNYRYLYTRVNGRQCAIWAIPFGPQRHYASSFFVVWSPGWMRAGKGQAMSDEELARIPAIPFPTILTELKLCAPVVFMLTQRKGEFTFACGMGC
jgi:hypothetical protein